MQNNQPENLQKIRHSLAHLMAYCVKQLYPGSQNAIGPAIEDGFYQDFEIVGELSEADLPKIEQKMKEVLATWTGFERREVSLNEALEIFAGNKYKQELAREFSEGGKTLTTYTSGDFIDLCRGGHVDNIRDINPEAFKVTKTAGAYWKGDEKKTMLTRIYGVAFASKGALEEYLAMQEEAKKRDHRKLGQELELFFISESVGKGLPLMLPRGETVKHILMKFMRQQEEARGYTYVATPVLTQEEMYKRSGHADYYLENMYVTVPDEEGNKFYIKPMNCPHHHMIFERLQPSYKDLPLRLSEHAGLYRYELSGTLTGLIRMRGPITQNDSHMYMNDEQVEKEFDDLLAFFKYVYEVCSVTRYWYRLSLPDFSKGKYAGDPAKWQHAAETIRRCLEKSGEPFVSVEDEAAFYGPKLDVQIKNVLGKEDSIATVQIDILVPERMGITYVNAEGKKAYPVVIHKSIMGAFERFMGFLIEQTAGWFPFWLAPEQIRILTINDTVSDYVKDIETRLGEIVLMKPVKYNELRFTLDDRNESLGKKIREAVALKVPVQLIIGPKDKEARQVSVRTQAGEEKVSLDELEKYLQGLAESRIQREA